MTCLRCGGLLRTERVGRYRLPLLACMACGDRIDRVILRHRRLARQEREPPDRWGALWRRIQGAVAQGQMVAGSRAI